MHIRCAFNVRVHLWLSAASFDACSSLLASSPCRQVTSVAQPSDTLRWTLQAAACLCAMSNDTTYLMLILLPQLTPCNGKDAASESRVDEQVAVFRQVGGHSGAEGGLLDGLVARECIQMVDALLRAFDEFVEVIWRPHF